MSVTSSLLPIRILSMISFRSVRFLIAERTGFDGLWGVEKDLHLHCKIREKYIVSSSLSITNGNRKKGFH